ncbi:MAG: deoxyribose-phosphate aldolase [Dysgonamonadaceae bacterium]|jgi:deoxyribose-phosphate aldolase|nr:deoxyribose-phosphate aldolase [Dysgonamonadaceae bacterium]
MEKYQLTLNRFKKASSETSVKQAVQQILAGHFEENNNANICKFLYGCLDLTSLNPQDSKESIWKLVEKVNAAGDRPDICNVAAICVYPNLVSVAREALTTETTRIASVAGGFPSSQTFTEIKIAETALAVADGADEIDTVINLGAFLEQEYEEMCEEIMEIKEAARNATLKVILETGLLTSPQQIKDAAILSIYSGADFIKTSTGKNGQGATPEAFYVMCEVIREYNELYNKKIGIKAAGGIRTVEEAIKYYTIVKETLGEEWLSPTLFRIGASSLADELLKTCL